MVIPDNGHSGVRPNLANDGTWTNAPDDSVTVDLASRKLARYQALDLGHPKAAYKIKAAWSLEKEQALNVPRVDASIDDWEGLRYSLPFPIGSEANSRSC